MNSDSLPTASTPRPTDNVEVLSQRAPSRGEVVLEAPQGDLPDSMPKGGKAPEGSKSGSRSDTAPEPSAVPESDRRHLHKKGKPAMPATSVHPEAADNFLEALNGASINEENRIVMSAVIQKVQSAKSGLTEACANLLTGFQVSNQIIGKYYRIDSSP